MKQNLGKSLSRPADPAGHPATLNIWWRQSIGKAAAVLLLLLLAGLTAFGESGDLQNRVSTTGFFSQPIL